MLYKTNDGRRRDRRRWANGGQACAIYTRISDDREGEAKGVKRQEDDCRKLAERNGLEVYELYSDNDIGASGKTDKRKKRVDYPRLLADARAGKFEYIIAYSFSRLTRRPREFEDLVDLSEQHGIKFKTCVSGEPDLSTADGRMTARLVANIDAAEADRISERVRRKKLESARKGKVAKQWKRPFGFLEDGVTHHPEEAQLIREAVDDIIGGASLTSIRRKWEREGVKTSTGGEVWNWAPTWRVLFGWRTVGIREYPQQVKGSKTRKRAPLLDDEGEMVRAEWEPIITLEQRTKALKMLERRTRRGERQGKWLLQGLLRCGLCGRKMYGAHMKAPRTSSYSCKGSGTTHMAISAELVETYIEQVNNRYLLDKALHGVKVEEQRREEWTGKQRLTEVNVKLAMLEERFVNESGNGDMLLHLMDKLNEERRTLQKERSEYEAQTVVATQVVRTFDEAVAWFENRHEKSIEERQLALQQEIEHIVVQRGERGHSGKSHTGAKLDAIAKRVTISWREPHYEFNGVSAEEAIHTVFTGLVADEHHRRQTPQHLEAYARELEKEARQAKTAAERERKEAQALQLREQASHYYEDET